MVIIMLIVIGFVVSFALAVFMFDISVLKTTIKNKDLFSTVCLSCFALLVGIIIIGCIVAIPTGITHCKECHKFYWDKNYCEVCGNKLRDVITCDNCNKEFSADKNYCPYCGYSVCTKEKTTDDE